MKPNWRLYHEQARGADWVFPALGSGGESTSLAFCVQEQAFSRQLCGRLKYFGSTITASPPQGHKNCFHGDDQLQIWWVMGVGVLSAGSVWNRSVFWNIQNISTEPGLLEPRKDLSKLSADCNNNLLKNWVLVLKALLNWTAVLLLGWDQRRTWVILVQTLGADWTCCQLSRTLTLPGSCTFMFGPNDLKCYRLLDPSSHLD